MTQTRLEFHWCVPVAGDGFYLGLPAWERPPSLSYAVEIAKIAERFGYRHLLIGMGFTHHQLEAWTLATAMLTLTEQIGAMVAVRPGFISAPVLAKMAVTLDRFSQGRLSLNIVTGGKPDEQAMYGDYFVGAASPKENRDARYRRTLEFMEICRRLWSSTQAFDYEGEFYNLKQTRLETLPIQPNGPLFYFGGASAMATQVGAAEADVYLMWGEPLGAIGDRIQAMKSLVAKRGRTDKVRYGLRINIVARRTELEAVAAAAEMISKVSSKVLEQGRMANSPHNRGESVGQSRQREFRSGADANWYVEPGLWAGIAVVRSGAGMAIVGSYQQVADRLLAYIDLGITVLILSGYPHLEECENIGRNVLPLVREGYLGRYRDRLL